MRRTHRALCASMVIWIPLLGCGTRGDVCDPEAAACVDGEPIAVVDLEVEVRRTRLGGDGLAALDTLTEEGRRRVLAQVTDTVALSRAASAAGVDRDPAVRAEIASATRRILARHHLAAAMREHPITDAMLERYYAEHPETFRTPREVRVRHVVVGDRAEADHASAEILNGADLARIAETSNLDASRPRGGDLGWIRPGVMEGSFERVAFSLAVGTTSAPLQTRAGWHVIRVEGERGGELPPFPDVRAKVRQTVEAERLLRITADARSAFPATTMATGEAWTATSQRAKAATARSARR